MSEDTRTARTASARDAFTLPFLEALRPREALSVSAWADRYRILPQKGAAMPGPWRTALTPYLQEIMDALGPGASCSRVVFMKGAQIGGTEAGNNWLGWIMHQQPAPTMYVLPTVELAKQISQQRVEPLIADCPELAERVSDRRTRDGGSTITRKQFPGGILVLTGANSGTGLRSMPARFLFCDELDAWEGSIANEGDPLILAERGTRTYRRNKKVLLVSTPTVQGRSRIEREFLAGDQSYYLLPCPECETYQRLRWSNLKWDKGDPSSVRYACEECGALIPEHRKTWMLARGRWQAEHPERSSRVRSFHLSALYSPLGWYSWEEAAEAWEKAQGNVELLQGFVNLVLGETWVQQGDAPDHEVLMARAEPLELGLVPAGGLILTAGVDVQKDRLEAEVVAWGEGRESWSIAHVVIPGDTSSPVPWVELSRLVSSTWPHESGVQLPLVRVCIDTGYNAQEVYRWVREHRVDQVLAVKGDHLQPMIIGQPRAVEVTVGGKRLRRGVKLWPVGVSVAKSELYGWLRLKAPKPGDPYPPGWCHLPHHPEEWFRQLVSEQLEPVRLQGRTVWRWSKLYDRNEALDCRIYARAAAAQAGIDRWSADDWQTIREGLSGQATAREARQQEGERRERRARGDGGWLDRWGR